RLAESKGRSLNAFIILCKEKALRQAEEIDAKVKAGQPVGPLAGVPIAVKDNICYTDYPTTCGSHILENFVPPYDATVVKRLVDAGAVIIGKTNLDEFGMGSSSETSYFGPVTNPAADGLVPGGSSGGSAAAVAAGIVPVALGSDTGGSIRQPAAFCGIYGLKPTYGAVSRYGLVAYASSLEQIGPLARNVKDLALVYKVITGHDHSDSTSIAFDHPDYPRLLQPERPFTIGVPREFFSEGLDPEIDAWIKKALHDLLERGHTVVDVSIPLADKAIATYYTIATAEASSNLARYDGVLYGLRESGDKELYDMYCDTRSRGFGTEVKRRIMLGAYVLSAGYYDAYYEKAAKVRELFRRSLDDLFKRVDLILSPTTPTAAFRIGERINDPLAMYLSDVYTVIANLAGLPAISVPFGQTSDGRPIGIQFMAPHFGERRLFEIASAMEGLK
ncbi:MAG: Asp-tRNA(Asn)/Glu-tRNA(Gln) amidotransferase subunit GatA, partial [Candidatus Zixiibacteriota bacterium]